MIKFALSVIRRTINQAVELALGLLRHMQFNYNFYDFTRRFIALPPSPSHPSHFIPAPRTTLSATRDLSEMIAQL
jgi:hypothetical protein